MFNDKYKVTFRKLDDERPHIGSNYCIEVTEYIGFFDFTESQMDEIKPMIKENNHIGLHKWFKENAKDFFKKCITDRDPNKIVGKIIREINNYLKNTE